MKKKSFELEIEVVTGLHIGSGGDKAQIGGIDSPVIKDPISKEPYIPGSSLKGKLRCLLETEATDEYPDGDNDRKINKYFGATSEYLKDEKKKKEESKKNNPKADTGAADEEGGNQGNSSEEESLSRFLFRDLILYYPKQGDDVKKGDDSHRKLPLEIKTEISISRETGKVKDGPRTIERIPPGTRFTGVILLRYKDESELDEMQKMVVRALELLVTDALGGSGSRGYGAVKVKLKIDGIETEYKLNTVL